MLQTRRNTLRLGQRLRSRPQLRHKSNDSEHTSSGHAAHAGEAEPAHHAHHAGPVHESLGRNFYLALAAFPLSYGIYTISRPTDGSSDPSAQPRFTRFINSYGYFKQQWEERNTTHTRMVEQAAHDRNLFQSSPGSRMIDLKFPEVFNTGSPYNVPAGHYTNLDQLIAHYQQKNREQSAKVAAKHDKVGE